MAEGYVTRIALDRNCLIIGYEFVNMGKVMELVKQGIDANQAIVDATGIYGRFNEGITFVDPRHE